MKKILMLTAVMVSITTAVWFAVYTNPKADHDLAEIILSLPRDFIVSPVKTSEQAGILKAQIRSLPDKVTRAETVKLLKSTIIDMPLATIPVSAKVTFLWQYWVLSMNVSDLFRTEGSGEPEMFEFLLEILSRYKMALEDCEKQENAAQGNKMTNDMMAEKHIGAKTSDEIRHDIKNAKKVLLRHFGLQRYCQTLPEQEQEKWRNRFYEATGGHLSLDNGLTYDNASKTTENSNRGTAK